MHRAQYDGHYTYFAGSIKFRCIILICSLVEGVPEAILFDCGNSQQRFYAAPSDCHSFYQCFDTIGPPIKMSCGFLHFNPLANVCDWPANVINIRPECDKTLLNFGMREGARKIHTSNPFITTTLTTTTAVPSITTGTAPKDISDDIAKVIDKT